MTIAAQLGRMSSRIETAARSREFAEYATALMRAKGNPVTALREAEANGAPQRVKATLKAAVAGATSSGADELAPLRILAEGFSATLANSAFDAVLADAHVAPLHVRFSVVTSDATAAVANEGAAKRMSSISLGTGTLSARKAATLVAISEELLRFNSAVGLIETSLRNGVAAAVDSIFLTALIAGTTPIASAGASAANAMNDIRRALDAATVTANSRFHLIVSPTTAARMATMTTATIGGFAFPTLTVNGGTLAGVKVHASDALTTQAVLVDANALVAAADPVEVRVSRDASVQKDSAPTQTIAAGSPPAPVASTTVSAFQTNSSVVIAERRFGWALVRATAVQSLSGVAWAT
jgi:HK97 family phage major capsid protein